MATSCIFIRVRALSEYVYKVRGCRDKDEQKSGLRQDEALDEVT